MTDNAAYTLKLLKNSLPKDETISVIDQNSHLYHAELKKIKSIKENLSYDDIKFAIKNCNILLENALNSNFSSTIFFLFSLYADSNEKLVYLK